MRHVAGAIRLLVVVASLTAVIRCGSSSPTAPIVQQGTQQANPVQTSFTITGNLAYTGTGQQGQLTATAGYADGTSKNITTSVSWIPQLATVATISPAGLLTTTGLGGTYIAAQNNAVGSSSRYYIQTVLVRVTPPGTLALLGWTREPGSGPLPGVSVREAQSGQSTMSNTNGDYALGGLSSAVLTFTKSGYEDAQFETSQDTYDGWPLQQVVRIDAGASVTQRLAPHDVDYVVTGSTHCQPCRLIRVTSTTAGTLHLRVTWTDQASALNIWVNGQVFPGSSTTREIAADVPVGVGELLVYVGKLQPSALGNYVPFTLSTSR